MTDFGKSAKGPTLTDLTSVASNATNINTVATNMQDVQDVATEINASPTLRSLMNSVLNDTITLDGLTDTNLGTLGSGQDGYALTWDWDAVASTGEWVPAVAASPVTQLSDLDVTDPLNIGDGLKWTGTAYIAAPFAEIGVDYSVPTGANQLAVSNGSGTFEFASTISGDYTFQNNITISGNLNVTGTTTTINTQDLAVADKSITLSNSATPTEATANGSGIDVDVTNMAALWTTDAPRIEYSSSNSGLDQYWNLNRGIVAKGWSDAGSNVYDGQITLNCSANSHGITIKSAPHADNATYDLILPASAPAAGQVLAQNSNNDQLEFVDVVKPASAAALASLTTVVGSTNVDVRRAKIETAAASADFAGDARFYNATAAVTLTMDDTALSEGDIITVYANGNDVTIAQDATNGFDTVKIDGTTAAHTGNVTVANGTIATISVISATAGSSFAVIAGQGVS